MMARRNHNCIYCRIMKNLLLVGGAVAKPKLTRRMTSVRAIGRTDDDQLDAVGPLHRRQQRRSRKASRSQQSHPRRPLVRPRNLLRPQNQFQTSRLLSIVGISNQHSKERLSGFPSNQLVRALRPLDWELMCDEGFQIELLIRKQLQKRIHIPRLSPAYVADGIVSPFLFIGGIVSTWSVRPRNAEVELLLVIELAFDVQAYRANCDDHRAIASHPCRKIYRVAAGRLGRNQHNIGAVSSRVLETHFTECRA